MSFWQDTQSKLHYLDDDSYSYLLPPGSIQITDAAAAAIQAANNNPPPTVQSIQAQINALDGGLQARSVRAMLIAIGGGDPISLAKLQALEAQITPLRAQIAALQVNN